MSKRRHSLGGEAVENEKRLRTYAPAAASPPVRKRVDIQHTTAGPSFDSSPTSVLQTPNSSSNKQLYEPIAGEIPASLSTPSPRKSKPRSYNNQDLVPRSLAATPLKEQRSTRKLYALLGVLASLLLCFTMLPHGAFTSLPPMESSRAALSTLRSWVHEKAMVCHVASYNFNKGFETRFHFVDKADVTRLMGVSRKEEKIRESITTWDPAKPDLAALGSPHISSRASITTPTHAPLACKSNSWVGCGL